MYQNLYSTFQIWLWKFRILVIWGQIHEDAKNIEIKEYLLTYFYLEAQDVWWKRRMAYAKMKSFNQTILIYFQISKTVDRIGGWWFRVENVQCGWKGLWKWKRWKRINPNLKIRDQTHFSGALRSIIPSRAHISRLDLTTYIQQKKWVEKRRNSLKIAFNK